ncbi:MAG TPA: cysteine desulfurase [Euryarchaeota archaeon]|nr:cysteine desulfurase [archaeon BMS3Bbin15]HDL15847.1 cysteine desulfurase [Euryarchaeota archaeon]
MVIYLDNSSTTHLSGEVLEDMLPYLKEKFGNPSNMHPLGLEARKALDNARQRVSRLINSSPSELIFTSGGVEANNLAVKGSAYANMHRGRHIIISAVEHLSIQHPVMSLQRDGFQVTRVKVDSYGRVDPEAIENAIRDDTVLISVQHANHEVGTIQPIAGIAEIAEDRDIVFHVDALASAGNYPIDVEELGISLLSLTAHHFYGPKGAGALFMASGTRLISLIEGGIQESGMRAGTENVPAIAGLGKAAEISASDMNKNLEKYTKLRKNFILMLEKALPEIKINGHPEEVLPSYVHVCIPGVEGEVVASKLSEKGIIVSSGSPCISRASKASHVLEAMRVPASLSKGALLFAFGRDTSEEDIRVVAEALEEIVAKSK